MNTNIKRVIVLVRGSLMKISNLYLFYNMKRRISRSVGSVFRRNSRIIKLVTSMDLFQFKIIKNMQKLWKKIDLGFYSERNVIIFIISL